MLTIQIDLPLARIAEACREYRVRELSVFGSALRHDFRPDSDIDLLVEFEPEARIGLIRYLSLQSDLADLLGRQVDLVEKAGLKRFVRENILNSAHVIYAK